MDAASCTPLLLSSDERHGGREERPVLPSPSADLPNNDRCSERYSAMAALRGPLGSAPSSGGSPACTASDHYERTPPALGGLPPLRSLRGLFRPPKAGAQPSGCVCVSCVLCYRWGGRERSEHLL